MRTQGALRVRSAACDHDCGKRRTSATKFIYLDEAISPRGAGFYEVGPDGFGDGPMGLEDVLAKLDGLAGIWDLELETLQVTADRAELRAWLEEAKERGSASIADREALDEILERIVAAALAVQPTPPLPR